MSQIKTVRCKSWCSMNADQRTDRRTDMKTTTFAFRDYIGSKFVRMLCWMFMRLLQWSEEFNVFAFNLAENNAWLNQSFGCLSQCTTGYIRPEGWPIANQVLFDWLTEPLIDTHTIFCIAGEQNYHVYNHNKKRIIISCIHKLYIKIDDAIQTGPPTGKFITRHYNMD
jgi:hypothetical protein